MAATKEIRKRAARPRKTPSVRLRRSDTGGPGVLRKRHGRGFTYVDADGKRVSDDEVLALIERKAAGEEVAVQPAVEETPAEVPDLMSALQASLDQVRKRDGDGDGAKAKKAPAKKAPARKKTAKTG